jgi:hypothetical protein
MKICVTAGADPTVEGRFGLKRGVRLYATVTPFAYADQQVTPKLLNLHRKAS